MITANILTRHLVQQIGHGKLGVLSLLFVATGIQLQITDTD